LHFLSLFVIGVESVSIEPNKISKKSVNLYLSFIVFSQNAEIETTPEN